MDVTPSHYELDNLVGDLNKLEINEINPTETLNKKLNHFQEFNRSNQNKFKFTLNKSTQQQVNLNEIFLRILSECWSNKSSEIYLNLSIQCLDAVRLLSRDVDLMKNFESDNFLNLIQSMADLSTIDFNEEKTDQKQLVNISALKVMSNLIFNSSFVQNFYVKSNVADSISIHLRLFNPATLHSPTGEANMNSINQMLFNLRILFLLTALSKDLRQKLEKLQLILYLIEIIDQLMKERLNVVANELLNLNDLKLNDEVDHMDHSSTNDYCYLKSTDLDLINEILKILYNLTMDTQSVRDNAISIGPMNPIANSVNNKITITEENEEEEAHLMHLVSILRDLITCKLECDDSATCASKLNDLHCNIINLLTNMPSSCYEELMTPVLASNTSLTSHLHHSSERVRQLKQKNINVRIAQIIKRNSRNSKRKIKRTTQKIKSTIKEEPDETSVDSVASTKEQNENYLLTLIRSDEDMEFESKNMEAVAMILSYMSQMVSAYINKPISNNSDRLYPVLLLLILMSKANKIIRHYSRLKVLPPLNEKDLLNLPQNGLTIRNRLVKLMTDPNIQVKRLSAQFLYVLCKEDVNRLIRYTGYGNAAGLLVDLGILINSNNKQSTRCDYSSDSDENDSDDYKRLEHMINPVTGRVEDDSQQKNLFEGMSEEQKEYEAMKLVTAFDQLSRMTNGIIKPARIGADGKPVELEHILQLQDEVRAKKSSKTNRQANEIENDDDTITD